MKNKKRIRDYGINIGKLKTGNRNSITDVAGVKVGHTTLDNKEIKTGVTVITPHQGNMFKEKLMAASHVINGFGKSMGTIQINELGTLETPIVLTNTLSIGVAADALIEYMLENNDDIGKTTGTVNPIVCECNDGYLNDIRGSHVKREHIFKAFDSISDDVKEGAVGAGTGMSCYGLKGGIGTSSRVINIDDNEYTIGILVLSNFGRQQDFIMDGVKVGQKICEIEDKEDNERDKGSIIMILATDIPMTSRQLKRISKRTTIGLNRTGSYMGNGSGEVVIAFSTANKIDHYDKNATIKMEVFNEVKIDEVFRAVGEATEEAILNSLISSETTYGRDGHFRKGLKEYISLNKNG
ncbi:P1 family peptidase [Dethiothermospora halolimnae]|uniref:DmpA family aminopeptidase n=1 Tax=Dethiothermospora halolimnae TaxID=3114390 RepID=UPI003CCB91F1